MFEVIFDIIKKVFFLFFYLDGLMFELKADGWGILSISLIICPLAIVGIVIVFGLSMGALKGLLRLLKKFITRPIFRWLKRNNRKRVRRFLAFIRHHQRRNHKKQKQIAAMIVHYLGYIPILILLAAFLVNFIPMPFLTAISIIAVGFIKETKRGFWVIVLANILKPVVLLEVVPWLYYLTH